MTPIDITAIILGLGGAIISGIFGWLTSRKHAQVSEMHASIMKNQKSA